MLLKKFWARSLVLGLVLSLFMTGSAFSATVSSMVARDKEEQDYIFDYSALIESYTLSVIGMPAVLYDDFSKKNVVAISTENKGPVDYADVLNAYTLSVIEGKKFDVVTYIESSNSVIFETRVGTKIVLVVDDKLSLIDWEPPALPDAFELVNTLTKTSDMRKVLAEHADELELSLDGFNKLNTYGKNVAAGEVITRRPESGYGSTEVLKSVFDSGVKSAAAELSAALKAVNDASTLAAMQKALTDNAAALMLDIERYNNMHVFAREYLARKMLAGRAYDSAEEVRNAYTEAADHTDATIIIKYTNYGDTLSEAVEAQMKRNPQTDLFDGSWRTADSNMVSWHINPLNFNETNISAVRPTSNVNLREGPSTGFPVITTLSAGTGPYFVINEVTVEDNKTWYRVMTKLRVGWVHGDFVEKVNRRGEGIFQFLLLSEPAGIPADEMNEKILKGRGALEGMAEAFIEGGNQHNVNEIFLVALALHETGRGTSTLANGIEWDGKDGVKIVYNMFGIGAVDEDPINKGAQYAYDRGWFTPELAIIGGAQFTSLNYIHHSIYRQDTLYKMRWNPASPGSHQYATDIGWAAKQVKRIKELYEICDTYVLRFDLPRYKK